MRPPAAFATAGLSALHAATFLEVVAPVKCRRATTLPARQDVAGIVPRPAPESTHGELLVKVDACTGATIATLPLDRAFANPALTTLKAHPAPHAGVRDLCFVFSGGGPDPLWAIDSVQLVPAR